MTVLLVASLSTMFGGVAVVALLTSCADMAQLNGGSGATAAPITEGPPPDWLDRPGQAKDELCAVGVSGPSYYLEDAIKNSHAQALTELARSVKVEIVSGMDLSVSGGGDFFQSRISERANLTTDAVVHHAQVRGKWVSPGGYPTRGEKGTVYTWVCVPRDQMSGRP
jgi:hypothetical protein